MTNTQRSLHTLFRSLLAAAVLSWAGGAAAVVLDDDNRLDVTLSDGTQVTLYGEAGATRGIKSANYYYLPVNLRLSQRPDRTPEFLFLKFTTEQSAAQGGISGALMHFLMEWGLTPAQEADLAAKLKQQNRNAQLKGAVPMESEGGEAASFQIVSATLTDKGLAPSVVTSGKAPLVPGGKVATASRLTAEGAQLMAATFEKARSITDLSIALNFGYQTLTPAAKGRITFDWSKLEKEGQTFAAEYERKRTGTQSKKSCFLIFCASSSSATYSYSYEETAEQWKFLQEKQVVKFEFQETLSDERVSKIRDAFLQFFLNTMAQPEQPEAQVPPAQDDKAKEEKPNIRTGDKYTYKTSSFKKAFARKTQVFDLNYRIAVKRPYQLVGNLASWYNGVRDNPKCVASVNLNDPFFQHRDINFILDLDAKEIFDEAINYVTVNVRKNRSSGQAFEDRVTLDARYLKEKGINATVTYARGDDRNPDLYEYQAQWSLKGGNVWPANPAWEKGSWEGVTLAPPVVPRTLEVEGDLQAMQESGITRVTVQVHYPRFGQEVEENIHLSPAQGQPLVSKRIFTDRGAKGYAYRLVVNHKTEGKLALPWSAQVGDDYIYAAIPAELLAEVAVKEAAKEAARAAVTGTTEKVLDRFKDVIGGGQ